MTKAMVDILQKRIAEGQIIIEADVKIKSITTRRRYFVNESLNSDDIKKHISDKIIEEENRNVIGERFEVEF